MFNPFLHGNSRYFKAFGTYDLSLSSGIYKKGMMDVPAGEQKKHFVFENLY